MRVTSNRFHASSYVALCLFGEWIGPKGANNPTSNRSVRRKHFASLYLHGRFFVHWNYLWLVNWFSTLQPLSFLEGLTCHLFALLLLWTLILSSNRILLRLKLLELSEHISIFKHMWCPFNQLLLHCFYLPCQQFSFSLISVLFRILLRILGIQWGNRFLLVIMTFSYVINSISWLILIR